MVLHKDCQSTDLTVFIVNRSDWWKWQKILWLIGSVTSSRRQKIVPQPMCKHIKGILILVAKEVSLKGGRHSSVFSSVPTIPRPRVRIPCTSSMLFSICIYTVVLEWEKDENKGKWGRDWAIFKKLSLNGKKVLLHWSRWGEIFKFINNGDKKFEIM